MLLEHKPPKEKIISIFCRLCSKRRYINKMLWKEGKLFKCECGCKEFNTKKGGK